MASEGACWFLACPKLAQAVSNLLPDMKSMLHWVVSFIVLLWAAVASAQAPATRISQDSNERHFEQLKVGELNFTNVWVHRQTNFNILIRHSRGIHTIKLSDLPGSELAELRSQIGDLADMAAPVTTQPPQSLLARLKELLEGKDRSKVLIGAAAVVLVLVLVVTVIVRRRDKAP